MTRPETSYTLAVRFTWPEHIADKMESVEQQAINIVEAGFSEYMELLIKAGTPNEYLPHIDIYNTTDVLKKFLESARPRARGLTQDEKDRLRYLKSFEHLPENSDGLTDSERVELFNLKKRAAL